MSWKIHIIEPIRSRVLAFHAGGSSPFLSHSILLHCPWRFGRASACAMTFGMPQNADQRAIILSAPPSEWACSVPSFATCRSGPCGPYCAAVLVSTVSWAVLVFLFEMAARHRTLVDSNCLFRIINFRCCRKSFCGYMNFPIEKNRQNTEHKAVEKYGAGETEIQLAYSLRSTHRIAGFWTKTPTYTAANSLASRFIILTN